MVDFKKFFNEADKDIREGQLEKAQKALNLVLKNKIGQKLKRNERLLLASLLRRVGLSEKGLKILHGIVRSGGRNFSEPSEKEICEYSAGLIRIGGCSEARDLLAKVPETNPDKFLYTAFSHIHEWNYQLAKEMLLRFFKVVDPRSYGYLVAQVNFSAALIFLGEYSEAEETLLILKEKALKEKNYLLFANCCELLGQTFYFRQEFSKCLSSLEEASQVLKSNESSHSMDSFVVKKWKVFCESKRLPSRQKNLFFKNLSREASLRSDVESLRDIDFHWSIASEKTELLNYNFFGTPHDSYRQRIIRHLPGETMRVSQDFYYSLNRVEKIENSRGRFKKRSPMVLDLETGDFSNGEDLNPQRTPLKVIRALTKDFYQAPNMFQLASRIFPGRYFHPLHTTNQVHQALWRTRDFFKKEGLSLEIKESKGHFSLRSSENLFLKFSVGEKCNGEVANSVEAKRLKKNIAEEIFSSADVARVLKVSKRSAQLLVKKLLNDGSLVVNGKGPKIRYTFGSTPSKNCLEMKRNLGSVLK